MTSGVDILWRTFERYTFISRVMEFWFRLVQIKRLLYTTATRGMWTCLAAADFRWRFYHLLKERRPGLANTIVEFQRCYSFSQLITHVIMKGRHHVGQGSSYTQAFKQHALTSRIKAFLPFPRSFPTTHLVVADLPSELIT